MAKRFISGTMVNKIPQFILRIVFILVLMCISYAFLKYFGLAFKVFCGDGLCLTRDGLLTATILGKKDKWPYFIVDFNDSSSNLRDVFSRGVGEYPGSDAGNKSMPDRWVIIHDNRKFPFGDLYWFSENAVHVSHNGLWDKLSLFGKWILLSEVALNCTYDVRNDMKGLDAELAITNNVYYRRYVWASPERQLTNIISSVDVPVKLFVGNARQ